MGKTRMEAFSDGVIAIILTIMVLELKVPEGGGHDIEALKPLAPVFLAYVLSFIYVAIYWNNHHHMLHTVRHVTAGILWANLHLLFWLSLFPFMTAWVGETHAAPIPTAVYGLIVFMAAIAYIILQRAIIATHGRDGVLGSAVGSDWKGKVSAGIYLVAFVVAHYYPWIAIALYALVAAIWIVPDRRIERAVTGDNHEA